MIEKKQYDLNFGPELEKFTVCINTGALTFEIYKNFREKYVDPSTTEQEYGELIKSIRTSSEDSLLICNDLRPISGRGFYHRLCGRLVKLFAKNLRVSNPQFDLVRQATFGSSNSLSSTGVIESETIPESVRETPKIEILDMATVSEPVAKDLIKNMPKYSRNIKFRAYKRQVNAYYRLEGVTLTNTKFDLLEFALSCFDREFVAYEDVKRVEGDDFEKVTEKLVSILDGVVSRSEGKATRDAYGLKLKIFDCNESYHDAFLDLRGANPELKESILVDAFLTGIHINNIKNNIEGKCLTTLYENFEWLCKFYQENNRANITQINNVQVNGRNNGSNNNNPNRSRNNKGKNKGYNRGKNFNQNNQPGRSNNLNWRNDNQFYTNKIYNVCHQRGHIGKYCPKSKQLKAFFAAFEESESGVGRGEDQNGNENDVSNGQNNFKVLSGIENVNIFSNLQQDIIPDCRIVVSDLEERSVHDGDSNRITDITDDTGSDRDLCPVVRSDSDICSSEEQRSGDILEFRINFQCHDLIRRTFVIRGSGREIKWSPYIDSGAQRSVMSKNIADLLGLKINRNVNFKVVGFDRKPSNLVFGYIESVELVIPGTSRTLTFSPIILNDPNSNLCGLDVIVPSGGGTVMVDDSIGARYVFDSEKSAKHNKLEYLTPLLIKI